MEELIKYLKGSKDKNKPPRGRALEEFHRLKYTYRIILLELLNENNENIIFDLNDVEDLDSISLSLLITFAKMFSRKFSDTQIKVVNASKDIKNLFTLTRINKFYNITD